MGTAGYIAVSYENALSQKFASLKKYIIRILIYFTDINDRNTY